MISGTNRRVDPAQRIYKEKEDRKRNEDIVIDVEFEEIITSEDKVLLIEEGPQEPYIYNKHGELVKNPIKKNLIAEI